MCSYILMYLQRFTYQPYHLQAYSLGCKKLNTATKRCEDNTKSDVAHKLLQSNAKVSHQRDENIEIIKLKAKQEMNISEILEFTNILALLSAEHHITTATSTLCTLSKINIISCDTKRKNSNHPTNLLHNKGGSFQQKENTIILHLDQPNQHLNRDKKQNFHFLKMSHCIISSHFKVHIWLRKLVSYTGSKLSSTYNQHNCHKNIIMFLNPRAGLWKEH